MSFETVKYELDGAVATITMNRPEALNALSLQLTRDLLAAVQVATADGARAIILTGEGRAFCSGRRACLPSQVPMVYFSVGGP